MYSFLYIQRYRLSSDQVATAQERNEEDKSIARLQSGIGKRD